jgi:hypothetical protein
MIPGLDAERRQQGAHPPGCLPQLAVGQHEIVQPDRGVIRMPGGRVLEQGTEIRHGTLQLRRGRKSGP